MARPRPTEHLPPPLPPEERTVGQLIAESLKLYRRRFLRCLLLGLGPAATGVGLASLPRWVDLVFAITAGGVLLTASFIGATVLAAETTLDPRAALVALAGGVLVFAPFPFLASVFVLPGIVWLAMLGLVVPVAVIERTGLRRSFARAFRLARADYVHSIGSLAALTIVFLVTASVLYFLLLGFGEAALAVAAFLALAVVSPVVLLGSALLYFDQAARL